jgi:hypothetical protein
MTCSDCYTPRKLAQWASLLPSIYSTYESDIMSKLEYSVHVWKNDELVDAIPVSSELLQLPGPPTYVDAWGAILRKVTDSLRDWDVTVRLNGDIVDGSDT